MQVGNDLVTRNGVILTMDKRILPSALTSRFLPQPQLPQD